MSFSKEKKMNRQIEGRFAPTTILLSLNFHEVGECQKLSLLFRSHLLFIQLLKASSD